MKYTQLMAVVGALCAWAIGAQAEQTPGTRSAPLVVEHPGPASVPGPHGEYRCPRAPVAVMATTEEEGAIVCSAARVALDLLRPCGIAARRPVLVRIEAEVRNPFGGAIFGRFDTRSETALITREANIPSLANGTHYARIPPRAFYKSLIVHEVVHAIMYQNRQRAHDSRAMYEYPAYALQFESLSPDLRTNILNSILGGSDAVELIFNDILLAFDPIVFAVSAYRHFKASHDGCLLLNAILAGDARFIATLPP